MNISFFNKPISNTAPSRVVSLPEIHQMITGSSYTFQTQRVRIAKKDDQKKLKSENLDYVTFSGVFSKRGEKFLEKHSGLITLDIDSINDIITLKEKILNDKQIVIGLMFRSPSGNGLKCIVPIDINVASHYDWFRAFSIFFKEQYHIDIDQSGRDVARACFLCHDPEAYLNPAIGNDPSTPIQQTSNLIKWLEVEESRINVNSEKQNVPTKEFSPEILNDVSNLVVAIEKKKIDLTKAYSNWRDIGFALADCLGNKGRPFFHRISKFYPDYESDECDKQYDNCIKAKGSGITIRTLFYHAINEGIEITSLPIQEEKSHELPTIPDLVYENLPDFLKRITGTGKSSTERDILLVGSLATLSASLENFYGIYDGKKVYPNFYFFLEGMAGSGKSILNHCRQLVMPIHDELVQQSKMNEAQYKIDWARYKEGKKENPALEPPIQPTQRMLLFPANISSAGMLKLLNDNDGRGLIFETEGDTLADTFNNKEFGNFSDSFRKAFHHESISSYRKTNQELFEIRNPQLSAVLSGTPKQIHNLIPNAENGLASRMAFYSIPMNTSWKNVFDSNLNENIDDKFQKLGSEFFQYYQYMKKAGELRFKLTHEQGCELNRVFEQKQILFSELLGIDLIGTVRRTGLINFRIAMIFSALRHLWNKNTSSELVCSNHDFENAVIVSLVLLEHAKYVFNGLPVTPKVKRRENPKELFFKKLPQEFKREDYLKAAIELSLNIKTAESYISKFIKSGLIQRYMHNNYIKAA